MIYLDSDKHVFTVPEVTSVFTRMITDPRFAHDRIPYYKALREMDKREKLAGYVEKNKSFPGNQILGPNGIDMAVCEWVEMGYGIFDGYSDGERLLSWLGPQFVINQERLKFRVADWRDRMNSSRGSGNSWACPTITATDVPLDGCIFDYCFDWDRYNYVSVPGGVKPSDTAIPCMIQYPVNVFGQSITDPMQLREWELVTKARLHMLERLIDGDWAATTVGDDKQEDGIVKFFDNFAERQGLEGYCASEFSPVTVPITGGTVAEKMAMFLKSLTSELQMIEFRAKYLDGQATIPFSNIVLLMNEFDAACITWYQACLTKCANTFWNINQVGMVEAFWEHFQQQFTAGAFGGGTVRLTDGREMSIMQMHHLPRGTVIMLTKGWEGARPNPWGMRVAAMQYTEFLRRVGKTSSVATMRYQVLMNGSWLREEPIDNCGDLNIRWNMRLFSNAPWMQRKWTGFPECTDIDFTGWNWPELPPMPAYSRCVPDRNQLFL